MRYEESPKDGRIRRYHINAMYISKLLTGEYRVIGLPSDFRVFRAYATPPEYDDGVEIYAHSQEFPEVPMGEQIPLCYMEATSKKD